MGSPGLGSVKGQKGLLTAILGVRGGSGCSLVCALLGRLLSKRGAGRIGVVDGTPSEFSSIPSYLTLPGSTHDLVQLEPYQGHLTEKLLEGFFPRSPEGAFYLPLSTSDEKAFPRERILPLLQDLAHFFDHLILDLSSFDPEARFTLLGACDSSWVLSTPDPSSLTSIRPLEKRLMGKHIPLSRTALFFNQSSRDQALPSDPSAWSKHFQTHGSIPFLGEGLSLSLREGSPLPLALEKALGPQLDLLSRRSAQAPPPSAPESLPPGRPAPALEEVHHLHQKLIESLRRSGMVPEGGKGLSKDRKALAASAKEVLHSLLEEMQVEGKEVRTALMAETLDLAFGFGPLEPYLRDPTVTEIMVNGPSSLYIEREGRLESVGQRFFDELQLRTIIERILAPIGRRVDESQPFVDGRLPDGSRVNVVVPPLSLNGPVLTIRKFAQKKMEVEDLIASGALTQEAGDFLGACVRSRKNIVVSGGTGSGKTTLLNILSGFIPPGERIVTIEDSAELQLSQEHVVRLESRPANLEGQGRVTIRDLVINSLRMRPDRIIVGEVRGGEALDMLQAMNTGHDGSLTTTHANSPRDALSRLETMALFSGLELPVKAIREQVRRAVHLVIQQARLADGKRGVIKISEVQGMEGDVIILQDLFDRPDGLTLVQGPFPPSFAGELEIIGYHWPGPSGKGQK